MKHKFRIMMAATFGLVLAGLTSTGSALAQDGVTLGGWIEVIGGTSSHDGGVDGIDRGFFSRYSVSYDTILDNGLAISGRAAFQLNQRGTGTTINQSTGRSGNVTRMDAATNSDPDVLFISVGGGFGEINIGAHAPASCALMPRPIAFVSSGVDSSHYASFSGLSITNETFSEKNYCNTPESLSYATPNIGGFEVMLTYAPDSESNQGTTLRNAQDPANDLGNVEDVFDVAGKWSGTMGALNASFGVGYQAGSNDELSSFTVAGTVGFGGFTFGASWFDNDDGPTTVARLSVPAGGSGEVGVSFVPAKDDLDTNEDESLEVESGTFNTITSTDLDGNPIMLTDTDIRNIGTRVLNCADPSECTPSDYLGDFSYNDEQDGWSIAGKYEAGNLTLAATYSAMERDQYRDDDLAAPQVRSVEDAGGRIPRVRSRTPFR